MKSPPLLISVDTGGTFTDFYVLKKDGSVKTYKVLSTPQDPSQAIQTGIEEMNLGKNFELAHGSTVATNAMLEGKGAKVALVTTEGFEDLLEIGRQNRPHLYRFDIRRPFLPLPPARRFSVAERVTAQGDVLAPLRAEDLKHLSIRLKKEKIESIAVCFLFSYLNPTHEKKAGNFLKRLGKPLSLSSNICPEYREYERFSTTFVNAYVAPVMARYLNRLQKRIPQKIRMMQSNGGSLSLEEASREAVRTLLSGPAGGALGALKIGKESGLDRLITLDIGGTSTDVALLDGNLELTGEGEVGGLPVKTPMIRIHTIGAGGGSLARLDAGGALRVGPESAGARPGPICYGRGGKELTVTDAHVKLGRLPPHHFLGGSMKLFPEKITAPLKALATRLGLKPDETAEGILSVANSNIVRAVRVISLERGHDPRNFTLAAFGGAGPLHACEVAEALQMSRVLIPRNPGLLSAYGIATADWVRDRVQTLLWKEKEATFSRLKSAFAKIKSQMLREAKREGFKERNTRFLFRLDVRYEGQSYELTVDFSPHFRKTFEALHLRQFGYRHGKRPMEVVNLRLQARVASERNFAKKGKRAAMKTPVISLPEKAEVFSGAKWRPASLYRREQMEPGMFFTGPAVVFEYSATTFVPEGWRGRCDENRNLLIEKKMKI
ncbi:MAG: hydantoinase/oxoprolinase family protein [bacterium]